MPNSTDENMWISLSAEQQKLWSQTHALLVKKYQQLGRTAKPMTPEEMALVDVPLVMDGSRKGPLPWDARLLLAFDRDLVLAMPNNDRPLFGHILRRGAAAESGIKEMFSFEFDRWGIVDEEEIEPRSRKGFASFIKAAAKLPALLDLPQLGGDEIPFLWPSQDPQACSLVVHYDYDDIPEFYLRSTCLFSYVLEYIDWNDATDDAFYFDEDGYPHGSFPFLGRIKGSRHCARHTAFDETLE